jgi:methionyl-tRNA formyltransferase
VTDRPVRTVFLGSGAFAVPILQSLTLHSLVDLVGVVTAPPRPAGRSGTPTSTPVALAAPDGVPLLTPERLRAPASLAEIGALHPELAVLADYGQIVPAPLLELQHGALNLHPSLLPRHRGASPIPATILAGDTETGVTLIRMDMGLDTGDIVAVERILLAGDELAPELEERLATIAAGLVDRSIGPWLDGTLRPHPQADAGANMTRPLRREDGRLDPRRSALELERLIRAYQPWPGSFVDTALGRLVVWSATPGDVTGDAASIGTFDATGLSVGVGERLTFAEVQPAGGRRMSWDAFLRGHPSIIGTTIVE